MTEMQRAMLGDKKAQRQITERGELLPCCGEQPTLHFFGGLKAWAVECSINGHIHNTGFESSKEKAIDVWNSTRPILTMEQINALEAIEEK